MIAVVTDKDKSIDVTTVKVMEGGVHLGTAFLVPHSDTMVELHLDKVEPIVRGKVLPISKYILATLFESRPELLKVFVKIPATNRLAVKLAKQSGFIQEGVLTRCSVYQDEVVDLLIYGLGRPNGGL